MVGESRRRTGPARAVSRHTVTASSHWSTTMTAVDHRPGVREGVEWIGPRVMITTRRPCRSNACCDSGTHQRRLAATPVRRRPGLRSRRAAAGTPTRRRHDRRRCRRHRRPYGTSPCTDTPGWVGHVAATRDGPDAGWPARGRRLSGPGSKPSSRTSTSRAWRNIRRASPCRPPDTGPRQQHPALLTAAVPPPPSPGPLPAHRVTARPQCGVDRSSSASSRSSFSCSPRPAPFPLPDVDQGPAVPQPERRRRRTPPGPDHPASSAPAPAPADGRNGGSISSDGTTMR